MLKFTSIVGYTSCGPTYIESFLTIFGQCINVLNYNVLMYYNVLNYNELYGGCCSLRNANNKIMSLATTLKL